MSIILYFFFFCVPEDSNCQYLLDKQLAHYFPEWEARFDSLTFGFRTSQGCLDLLNWYISLDTKLEAELTDWFGLRYRNEYLADYGSHISNHRFEPYFRLWRNFKFLFTITTHYYKGEDEVGTGVFFGGDYLNFFELFVIAEDFDRNFSLKNHPAGAEKIIYKQHPIKVKMNLNRYWSSGHLSLKLDLSNRYRLESTEPDSIQPPSYREKGLHRNFYTRVWQDIGRLRLGFIFNLQYLETDIQNTMRVFSSDIFETITETMIGLRLNDRWRPYLYLTYNHKNAGESVYHLSAVPDSLFDYQRKIYAYLVDLEYHPGGRFVWHFGTQRQFYFNNQPREFAERRINLGFEYRYKRIWFYFVEAMEGDFPTPKWLHNHTYLQLMLSF